MSSASAALAAAWDNASGRLSEINEEISRFASPLSSVQCVNRLDAELLDTELVVLLRDPVTKALASIPSFRSRFDDELSLLIRLLIYKLSVWDTGASYGAKLQGLRYARPNSQPRYSTRSGLSTRTMALHSTVTILIPYLHSKVQAYALSRSWPDAPSSDIRRRVWDVVLRLESVHSTMSLINFVAFLANGRYRTLVDRLLRLRLVSTQDITRRAVSYEFMNRQMVWHAFSEFLLFLLPIINVRSVRRMIRNAAPRGSPAAFAALSTGLASYLTGTTASPASKSGRKIGRWSGLPVNECPICADNAALDAPQASSSTLVVPTYLVTGTSAPHMNRSSTTPSDVPPEHPLNTAYTTSCNHLYCYICLSDAMLRARDDGGPPWECLRCTEPVTWSERAEADVPNGLDSDGSLDDYEFTDSLGESVDSIQTLDDSSSESHSR